MKTENFYFNIKDIKEKNKLYKKLYNLNCKLEKDESRLWVCHIYKNSKNIASYVKFFRRSTGYVYENSLSIYTNKNSGGYTRIDFKDIISLDDAILKVFNFINERPYIFNKWYKLGQNRSSLTSANKYHKFYTKLKDKDVEEILKTLSLELDKIYSKEIIGDKEMFERGFYSNFGITKK